MRNVSNMPGTEQRRRTGGSRASIRLFPANTTEPLASPLSRVITTINGPNGIDPALGEADQPGTMLFAPTRDLSFTEDRNAGIPPDPGKCSLQKAGHRAL